MAQADVVQRRSVPASKYALHILAVLLLALIYVATPAKAAHDVAILGCCESVGDVNHSGTITSSDIIELVVYVFKSGANLDCPEEADANADGKATAADIIFLVNHVFRGWAAPAECPPLIAIVGLQPGADTVTGWANVPDTALYRVVLWAKTDRWYVQPFLSDPYTPIHGDSSWSNFTHPWDRIAAVLVDTGYVPVGVLDQHPSNDVRVIDWDEYPESSADVYIDWSGYRWLVKDAAYIDPGPNAFSNDTTNVRVDQFDRLHLEIDFRDATWYCSEIVLDESLGYGVYTFRFDSRVDSLDFNAILGAFIYDTTAQEFDFEFSQYLANPFNAQFVVQPWYNPGNIERFHMPEYPQTSHSFEWRSDRIVFQSWSGHAVNPEPATLIHSWVYTGSDIPIPGIDRMRFNLYLANGDPPLGGGGDEVIVTSFEYTE